MRLRAGILVLALAAAPVFADPVFVIEQLVINVTNAPGGDGERVATLKSADRVELLDKQGDDAHVQLPNGTEGWVKASYLTSEQPLAKRLQDRTAENEKLKQNVAHLESDLAAARAASGAAPEDGGAAAPGVSGSRLPVSPAVQTRVAPRRGQDRSRPQSQAQAQDEVPVPGQAQPQDEPRNPPASLQSNGGRDTSLFASSVGVTDHSTWEWWLASSAAALAAGFAAGWRTLDRRIRSKYGGLKIY